MRDFDDSTLWPVSTYERIRSETGHSGFARLDEHAVLPTTLVGELSQLRREDRESDLLDVVAACLRQQESALLLLSHRGFVWPLTLFPRNGVYHVPRPILESLQEGQFDLDVIAVEPPGLRPPGHPMHERIGDPAAYHPLPRLLWALAMHAPRTELLGDIGGRAAYRLGPQYRSEDGVLAGAMGAALRRLRSEIASLQDIAAWPGMSRERATRLLNAIYLQGGLMVLRTHPAARDSAGGGQRLRAWWRGSK